MSRRAEFLLDLALLALIYVLLTYVWGFLALVGVSLVISLGLMLFERAAR